MTTELKIKYSYRKSYTPKIAETS